MLEERLLALEQKIRDIEAKLTSNPPKGISGYASDGSVTEIPNPDDDYGKKQKK